MLDYINVKQINQDWLLQVPRQQKTDIKGLDAALFTIDHIKKKYPPPYTLCLSGGLDSQAMLYSWIRSGQEFRTYSAVYNDNFNNHDLEILSSLEQIYNIKINFQNFDIINFLFDEHINFVNTYRCGSPHMTTFMKFIEIINEGTVIFSGQPMGQLLPTGHRRLTIDTNNFAIYRYALSTKRSVVPWFLLETSEIAYGLIDPNYLGKCPHEEKYLKYRKNGFEVILPKNKYSGFEKIKDYFDQNYSHLVKPNDKLIRKQTQNSLRTFDVLFRNKYELKFASDKYQIKYV